METEKYGLAEAKFEVPSRGSMIQQYSDDLGVDPVSSDRTACSGKAPARRFRTARSERRSVSVTMSWGPLLVNPE